MDGVAMEFARENFGAANLGDRRLNQRLLSVAEQLAAIPTSRFPSAFMIRPTCRRFIGS